MATGRVKKLSVKKVEDTAALQWAQVVNRGEESRNAHVIKVLQKTVAIRHCDLQREAAALKKFLKKVNASSGYLNESETRKTLS